MLLRSWWSREKEDFRIDTFIVERRFGALGSKNRFELVIGVRQGDCPTVIKSNRRHRVAGVIEGQSSVVTGSQGIDRRDLNGPEYSTRNYLDSV